MATYDPTSLDSELKAAGLNIHGCSSTGRVDWVKSPSQLEVDLSENVKAVHVKSARADLEAIAEARLIELKQKMESKEMLTNEEMQEVVALISGIKS